ncbi:MAG: prepilin-type N-terminal cleavage/methylation domain-containing protein [Gammaproteobacteria bacterium]|nr:prepilin-type N-terminal cleavage/methylation domain-containing protein [Gammaproteobacteria bacterium]
MMHPSNHRRKAHLLAQRGFTLLEVLVAFVLLGLTLGVILQIFSTGLRNTTAASHYTQAAIIADSRLALLGQQLPLVEGESEGTEGEYSWHMSVVPHLETEESEEAINQRYQLFAITLRVRWRDGAGEPELQFDTLRLGAVDDL